MNQGRTIQIARLRDSPRIAIEKDGIKSKVTCCVWMCDGQAYLIRYTLRMDTMVAKMDCRHFKYGKWVLLGVIEKFLQNLVSA